MNMTALNVCMCKRGFRDLGYLVPVRVELGAPWLLRQATNASRAFFPVHARMHSHVHTCTCNRAIIGVVMPLALLLAAGAYVPTSPKRGVPVITSHAIRRMPDPRSEQATGSVVSTAVGTGPKVGTRRGVEDLEPEPFR